MSERVRLEEHEIPTAGTKLSFVPTGSTVLDLVLGGGWARGRVANIVGDKSAGKTLLAIEGCANFARLPKHGPMRYIEAEAAFDIPYARSMGLPKDVDMINADDEANKIDTVEKMNADLSEWLAANKNGLYILDSLDALSDAGEAEREIGTATYGVGKAKAMSEMFRRCISGLRDANATMFIISQIRDKIGVTFGETKTRSGGRALDFYSSQIVWLTEIEKLKRTVMGADRIVGVNVLARNKKNKVGKPFRQAEFSILFGYGIDDEASMLNWLKDNKAEGLLDKKADEYKKQIAAMREAKDRSELNKIHNYLSDIVRSRWAEIEAALEPPMGKYS